MKKTVKNGKSGGKKKTTSSKKPLRVPRAPTGAVSLKRATPKNSPLIKMDDKERARMKRLLEETQEALSFYKGNLSDIIIADRRR